MSVSTSLPQSPVTASIQTTKGRGCIYNDMTELVGNTPMVTLKKLAEEKGCVANIYAKLEFFNPLSSIKDRMALGMIDLAEQEGKINKDTVLIESTSGNTGIALSFVAAVRGYRLILTMPENMSNERKKLLKHMGAELVLTPANEGMSGAIRKAEDLVAETPNAFMFQQFTNPTNSLVHSKTTAEEIWHDTNGHVDMFIAGVGTGGTIQGVGEMLKNKRSSIKIVGVEPENAAVLSGKSDFKPHQIQGIGAGFIPEILNVDLLDEIIAISDEEAIATAKEMATKEGIPGGLSSGATLAAALKIGMRPEMRGKNIVVIIASCAERYLSTPLFD